MKHKSDLAKGWIAKGDSDLINAKRTACSDGPYDTACFHAQQAVEKYLKAMLAFQGAMIPRTHDLEELQLLCLEFTSSADFQRVALEELSGYAVSVRYDFEFWPDVGTAKDAVIIAETVRLYVLEGIPSIGA
jgi:HEPN domain-containing protein